MALMKCVECGKRVSTTAASCPHCGAVRPSIAPVAEKPKKPPRVRPSIKKFLLWSFAGLIALSVIAQIAGCSFQPPPESDRPSYFFSRYTHGWGWATWRRAWRLYDHEMSAWRTEREGQWLRTVIENDAERAIWARCFDETLTGQVDAWDYRWTLAVWRHGMKSILSYRNLISNIGFGADATHTRRASPWAALPLASMPFPLVHPDSLACDAAADELTSRLVFRPPSLAIRVGRKLRALFA